MKTILRNLLSVLRRFKMAMLLNVLGLSVAFSAFILIMMQVDYDRNFDRGIKDVDRIFRVEVAYESGTKQAIINRPLAEAFIRSSPHILAGSLLDPWGEGAFFYTEENGVRNNFKERWMRVFPEYADIFTFDMLDGSADKLKEPNMVLLPLSLSNKLFGNQSAVGKQLHMVNSKGVFTIGGVYRDFPDNSSVGNSIYYQLIYFRYPLFAFLLGFASIGVVLLPCVTAAYGFFLSFSVCCFTAAFGVDGVLLALAVFGLRCMVTLPCYFLLAAASWGTSAGLAAVSFGRGRRTAPVVYGRACWVRFGACCLALLAGVCAELFLSPVLLRLMLERILG